MTLTKSFTRIAGVNRAWFISVTGEVINCGTSHDNCLREHPEIFGNKRDFNILYSNGWVRVGTLGSFSFIDCNRITSTQLGVIQKLFYEITSNKIDITVKDRSFTMLRKEFLELDSPGEFNRTRGVWT